MHSSKEVHGEHEGATWVPCALEEERGVAWPQGGVGARRAQEMRGEEEEAFRCLVIPCAVKVSVVCEHAEDPVERQGKLVPVFAGVEVT